jgi:hypothetical protein
VEAGSEALNVTRHALKERIQVDVGWYTVLPFVK